MLDKLYLLFRYIVGADYGFSAEGNEQWYYTIADDKFAAALYFISHVIIAIVALFIDWKCFFSSAIVVIAFTSIAPDCCGINLFRIRYSSEHIVMLHTLVFALLTIATFKLPVIW